MIFPGESEAMCTVIELANTYGYGNIIHRLKAGWALCLSRHEDMSIKTCCLGALMDESEATYYDSLDRNVAVATLERYAFALPDEVRRMLDDR